MATINLFGASGHAKVIMDIIRAQGDDVGKIYDDNPLVSEICGMKVDVPSDMAKYHNNGSVIPDDARISDSQLECTY